MLRIDDWFVHIQPRISEMASDGTAAPVTRIRLPLITPSTVPLRLDDCTHLARECLR